MIKLVTNPIGLRKYNENVRRVRKENPGLSYVLTEAASCEDVFVPWDKFLKTFLKNYGELYKFVPENPAADFTGIYCCNLSKRYCIEALTDYMVSDVRIDYGVADNASQILDKANYDNECIVLVTPIFKAAQSGRDCWRWSRHGKYIGVQNPQCEYLFDEPNIDLVFVYEVHRLIKQ